jgi:hypothetical protein
VPLDQAPNQRGRLARERCFAQEHRPVARVAIPVLRSVYVTAIVQLNAAFGVNEDRAVRVKVLDDNALIVIHWLHLQRSRPEVRPVKERRKFESPNARPAGYGRHASLTNHPHIVVARRRSSRAAPAGRTSDGAASGAERVLAEARMVRRGEKGPAASGGWCTVVILQRTNSRPDLRRPERYGWMVSALGLP